MPRGLSNTPKDKVNLNSFIGGQSVDFKYGIANSFYSAQALDFRQKASQMSVLPGFKQLSGNLNDKITAMVQDQAGVRWCSGDQGWLYKISTAGVISTIGKLNTNGSAGIAYNQQSDQLYIPSQRSVSLYGQVTRSTSPTFRSANFSQSASVASGTVNIFNSTTGAYDTPRNNAQSISGGITSPSQVSNTLTNTYTVPVAPISEASGQYCPFVPDIEPFYSVAVYFIAKGSGDVTLTMHDSLNNSLGAVTITAANMVNGWNEFIFTSPGIRAIPNAFATGNSGAYHFHLTSTVADSTVATINAGDLTGANMLLFAYRLVTTNNGWHPTTIFGQYLCIGNGSYLSTYDFSNDSNPNNTQWQRHRLSLDFGYEVCGLAVNNQYLVIAAEKRSTSASKSFQDGMLYFWDGVQTAFNFKIEIPMGAPYSVQTVNNITYFICAGSLFAWGGGQQVIKVRYIGYQNTDYLGAADSTIVNPNMMDVRYNLLMIGYPSSTTITTLNYGIYSWGAVELTYPNSFGYSYIQSGGLQTVSGGSGSNAWTNLQLGLVKNFVDTMYMSWQYTDANSTVHYGLDILDNTSKAATVFNWRSLVYDGGVRYKTKKALRYKISFLSLPSGCTITPFYQLDRSGTDISADPNTGTSYTVSSGTSVVIELNNLRFRELQWGFTGTTDGTVTNPPTITSVAMEVDPLEDETNLRQDYT